MAFNKISCYATAIEIAKAYAASAAKPQTVDVVLEHVYNKLKELQKDVDKSGD